MRALPNGLKVFNGTPHTIRFWDPEWPEPIEVEKDAIVSAEVRENRRGPEFVGLVMVTGIEFVTTEFVATDEGREIVVQAYRDGADVVIGSIIAAQAYPGLVVAMTPAEGYERVPPAEKRMRPSKFTIFPG